jgi:hypothetical protein
MRTLTRGPRTDGAGLIRILALAMAIGWCGRLEATRDVDKFWQIRNELKDRQTHDREKGKTTETRKISSESRICSNVGDEVTDTQRNELHPDGSYEDYQWIFLRDEDGTTASIESVTVTDRDGSYRVHNVTIVIDPYGERSTETEDSEFDRRGNRTKHTESSKREKVYQPYWVGSVTSTTSLDETETTSGDFAGIGRNQVCKSTARHTISKVIKALLLPPKHPSEYHAYTGKLQEGFSFDYGNASGANSSITEAQIECTLKDVLAYNTVSTQEIHCDGKWMPWRHVNKSTITDETSGSGQKGCGVFFNPCTGDYEISVSSVPEGKGTHTIMESDSITAGKCWGSHDDSGTPLSIPTDSRFDAIDIRGTVGLKRGDVLEGQKDTQIGKATITTKWHLNLVTQAKPGAPLDEW